MKSADGEAIKQWVRSGLPHPLFDGLISWWSGDGADLLTDEVRRKIEECRKVRSQRQSALN